MGIGVERRNDVGGKVAITILTGMVMLMFGLFVNATWTTASEGKNKAFEIGERMTAMEARFASFQGDLSEIKELLKRRIPGT